MTKHEKRAIALVVLPILIGGCASGGGGSSGGSGPATDPATRPLRAGYEPSACGTLYGYPVQCVPSQRAAIDAAIAESEAAIKQMPVDLFEATYGYTPYWASSSTSSSSSAKSTASAGAAAAPDTGYVRMDFYYEPNAQGTIPKLNAYPEEYSARQGPPVEMLSSGPTDDPKAVNPFNGRPGDASVSSAGMGYQYQSFGAWNDHGSARGDITAWSSGRTTPASAVPSTGSATFTGKLVGFYVSPTGAGATAGANVIVDANFNTRSLGFASSGTMVKGIANPELDLRGTLSYAPGQNRFAGTLTNATGSLSGSTKGQFYGPKAEELGGALSVSGSGAERFVGAYGARR